MASTKSGTLLKLNRGAKTWSASDVRPKTVRLQDGTLTYSGGSRTQVAVELWHVVQLRQSTIANAPPGAFDIQMKGRPHRTYTFAPEPGSKSQGWLGTLAVAVPDSAVDHRLQALFRLSSGQPVPGTENSGQQQQPVKKKLSFWRTSSKRAATKSSAEPEPEPPKDDDEAPPVRTPSTSPASSDPLVSPSPARPRPPLTHHLTHHRSKA